MFRRLLLLGCEIALLFCAPADLSAGIAGSTMPAPPERVLDGATIFRLGKNENLCAITFDDGPGPHTAELLEILKKYKVRATFFVVGTQVERRPDLVRLMHAEGHEVANHTYAHATLRHQTEEEQATAIGNVQQLLEALGVQSRFVRPPFGRYDLITKEIAHRLGLRIVLWSVDSHDWRRKAGVAGLQSVGGGLAVRGVFLFHDTHEPTVNAMPGILDELAERQCRFVTISEYVRAIENDEPPQDVPISRLPDQPEPPREQPARVSSLLGGAFPGLRTLNDSFQALGSALKRVFMP